MNNQVSRGCSYNYRRSVPRDGACQRVDAPCPRPSVPCSCDNDPVISCAQGCPVAMGYIPLQSWCQPMPICQGLKAGTIFPDLVKPFCGKGGAC